MLVFNNERGMSLLQTEIHARVDAQEWNARLLAFAGGTIYQTTFWADYWSAYLGAVPHYCLVKDGGVVVAQLLLLEMLRGHESLMGRLKTALLPVMRPLLNGLVWWQGPVLGVPEAGRTADVLAACLRAVQDLASERGVTGIEYGSLPLAVPPPSDAERAVFIRSGYDARPHATIRIDCRGSLEALWGHLKSDVARTPIRKAQRDGVTVRMIRTLEDLHVFHRLVNEWRQEQRFPPYRFERHGAMWTHLAPHCAFFLAEHGGEALGGFGLWFFNGTGHLFTPVQSAEARRRKLYVGDLMYWEMIRWCHAQGLAICDLSGVAPAPDSEKELGIRRFKEKWGGRLIEYPMFSQPLHPARWALGNAMRRVSRRARTLQTARA